MSLRARAFGWFALSIVGYFAYVDQWTLEEATAAVLCAALVTALMTKLERETGPGRAPSLAGIAALIGRTPPALISETWLLTVVLWRKLVLRRTIPGRWVELRYDVESDDDPTRRALVILGSSISPNAIPLRIDDARGRIVLHQLFERPEPGARDSTFPF